MDEAFQVEAGERVGRERLVGGKDGELTGAFPSLTLFENRDLKNIAVRRRRERPRFIAVRRVLGLLNLYGNGGESAGRTREVRRNDGVFPFAR